MFDVIPCQFTLYRLDATEDLPVRDAIIFLKPYFYH